MKKLLLIFTSTVMLCVVNMKAQITLDTAVYMSGGGLGYDFKAVQISSTETKWFFADTLNNSFSLYNMDFTPFMMNIAVPEPFAPTTAYMQALYITRELFDCDSSNIEYAYYSADNIGKPFRVVRTDGTILFQVDSATAPYRIGSTLGLSDYIRPIINTSDGAKLFLQKLPLLNPIYIYSLCGSLPVDVFDFADFNQSFVSIFPNPASGLLTFQVNQPDNINEYELAILDNSGKVVKREKVHNSMYSIDVKNFSSGTYYYSLSTKNKSYQSGKFILTK